MLLLTNEAGVNRIPASSVIYIEKAKDDLVFHTTEKTFRERGSMRICREQLKELPFSECTAGCLVNLSYVTRVGKDSISMGDVTFPLSRRMKKQFTAEYINYVNGE